MNLNLRVLELGLIEIAGRLEVRADPLSARWLADCWSTIAELATGCHCEEAAAALLAGARRYLDAGGAA